MSKQASSLTFTPLGHCESSPNSRWLSHPHNDNDEPFAASRRREAQMTRQKPLTGIRRSSMCTHDRAQIDQGLKGGLGSGKKKQKQKPRERRSDYSGILRRAFQDPELTEWTANMWAGYFGWFPPPHTPTPSNHTPTSLATSRRALSPSIVLFGHSLTPPASSLHFLPALTVYSSLSCSSTSLPRQAQYASAVNQHDDCQH